LKKFLAHETHHFRALFEEVRDSREQIRRLSAHSAQIAEHERTELARLLHDQIGQLLAVMKIDLAWMSQRLPKASLAERGLHQKAAAMARNIDGAIRQIRRISTALRPMALDRLGLMAAVEWQAGEFERRSAVRCRFESHVRQLALDRDCATQIFRILQEALTNVSRHAGATRVTITARRLKGKFVLTVRDNGKGIADSELTNSKSFGLLGMRERALLIGADVSVGRAGRMGTTVRLTVSLPHLPKTAGA
jgi:signal transduction histidine kinase